MIHLCFSQRKDFVSRGVAYQEDGFRVYSLHDLFLIGFIEENVILRVNRIYLLLSPVLFVGTNSMYVREECLFG